MFIIYHTMDYILNVLFYQLPFVFCSNINTYVDDSHVEKLPLMVVTILL